MCEEWKPFSKFVPDKRKRFGITVNCRHCRNKRRVELERANPDRYRSYRQSREKTREWWHRTKAERSAYHRQWRQDNREKIAESFRERRDRDPAFRILDNLRSRLWDALKRHGASKSGRSLELFGCTATELRAYIESQFMEGMSWENYGKFLDCWHIDHIKPCSAFNLTDPEEQRACFHYTNLQPLWAPENLAKGKGPYRKNNRCLRAT